MQYGNSPPARSFRAMPVFWHFQPVNSPALQRVNAGHDFDPPARRELLQHFALAPQLLRMMEHVGLDAGFEGGPLVLRQISAGLNAVNELAEVAFQGLAIDGRSDSTAIAVAQDDNERRLQRGDRVLNG